jgi:hypothetical protein
MINQIEPLYEYDDTPLRSLMRWLGPLPKYTAIMGQASNGLPLLYDLSGSNLRIVADEIEKAAGLAKAILVTACLTTSTDDLEFIVLTTNPGNYKGIARKAHVSKVLSIYDKASGEQVIELASVTEQRKSGRERGAVKVLLIDDINAFLEYDDYDTAAYLHWLSENGVKSGITLVYCSKSMQGAFSRDVALPIVHEFDVVIIGGMASTVDEMGQQVSFQPMEV